MVHETKCRDDVDGRAPCQKEMMVVFVALLLSLLCICSAHGQERVYEGILKNDLPYPLPELHFTYEAFEPEIDSATVRPCVCITLVTTRHTLAA